MKWFVKGGIGILCHDFAEIIEEDSLEQADTTARHIAIENAESYGFEQDPDHFGGVLDYVGRNWDEEEQEYEEEGELEHEAVRYVPELHDDEL